MLLMNPAQYSEWARITHLHCVEKHTDISRLFFIDQIADERVANARKEAAQRIADICNQPKEEAPMLDDDADEEQLRTFILKCKAFKFKMDGREKQRTAFESCVAFIKTRMSEDMMKLIQANSEVVAAEKGYSMYNWWNSVRDVFMPKGTSRSIMAIKLSKDLSAMNQAITEDIKQYAARYSKCRDELLDLGYHMFNNTDLDGLMYIYSLNDKYLELKNAVVNGVTKADTFIEARELSLKWAIAQHTTIDLSEVAMAAIPNKFTKRNNKKSKRCYICKGEHMMADCHLIKSLKGDNTHTASGSST